MGCDVDICKVERWRENVGKLLCNCLKFNVDGIIDKFIFVNFIGFEKCWFFFRNR